MDGCFSRRSCNENSDRDENSDVGMKLGRPLIASLIDSHSIPSDGLFKKIMSIFVNGISHHMISYYTVKDIKENKFPRPSTHPHLQNITIRPELS